MVEKQDAVKDQLSRRDEARRAEEGLSTEHASEPAQKSLATPAHPGPRWKQKLVIAVLAALVLAAVWIFGVPWIEMTLSTVSTDDAYVNGHVDVRCRARRGQVARVLVDDNNRVRKGDLLVQLDKEPYETAVAVKKAAVEIANADLRAATAKVRGDRSAGKEPTLEIAARHGGRRQSGRAVARACCGAREEQGRTSCWRRSNSIARQSCVGDREPFLKNCTIGGRRHCRRRSAEVAQALADVQQIRVSLGLPPQPEGGDLGEVPPDLDQTFSSVLEAQAELIQSAAQLGVIHSYDQTPKADARGL